MKSAAFVLALAGTTVRPRAFFRQGPKRHEWAKDMLDPTPELPDDTPLSDVEFPARIRNVLAAAGLKTVGEVREISDETLLSFQDFSKGSIVLLRESLGLPSCDGVRPLGKKPT